jgi:hypothetical protein
MSDVIWHAKVGVSGVINGGIVVSCQETGLNPNQRRSPEVNITYPSGYFFNWYNNRFDEDYGGGPS